LENLIRSWIEEPPPRSEPPAIRRNFLTLAQARQLLARKPDWAAQYHGDLQMHTRWSDGLANIETMAAAGLQRGYTYIAITDHSQGLKIAGGINEADLQQQIAEIDQVNAAFKSQGHKLRALRSLELNLSSAGEGDMHPPALSGLDLIMGSFHSRLRSQDDQTDRYLAALQNPDIHILGHPRGRIYNHRAGLTADWPRVFASAARLNKAVEIDAYPDRQDLDIGLLAIAKKEGAPIAIDTDAHAPDQLAWIDLGLAAALLADIPPAQIINFMPRAALLKWARR
jgi:histidinol phosphatase-like PHP family hydrolase